MSIYQPDRPPSFKMEYRHGREPEGHFRSICLFCHHTVATNSSPASLREIEHQHSLECWKKKPSRVDRVEGEKGRY